MGDEAPSYWEVIRRAFDELAPTYDALSSTNPIGAWVREVSLRGVRETFPPGTTLLELGCGTGRDAVALAKEYRNVLALDISSGMVAAARAKVRAEGLEDRAIVMMGSWTDLPGILEGRKVDGVFANFSLLYDDPLRPIAEAVHRVLPPGGYFVFTLRNRVIFSEVVLSGLRMNLARVVRNLNQPHLHEIHGHVVRIRDYSPGQVKTALRDLFILRGLVGLPVFLPSVQFRSVYERLQGGQRLLRALDAHLAGRYPWNYLGEATQYRFQRVDA